MADGRSKIRWRDNSGNIAIWAWRAGFFAGRRRKRFHRLVIPQTQCRLRPDGIAGFGAFGTN